MKQNIEKKREVYFCDTFYRKVWGEVSQEWIADHVELLDQLVPGYVLGHGANYIDFNIVEGTLASDIKHTPEFFKEISEFCVKQMEDTAPYFHGDWSLSNIIISTDGMHMIDWDNVDLHPIEEATDKLKKDLQDAFKNTLGDIDVL